MATYYVRADGTVTAANRVNATSDAAASTSLDRAEHNLCTFSPGDIVVISDAGGVYRGVFTVPSAGSSGSLITYQASGSPIIKGSIDISDASYSWTASGSGTNEYYCRTSGNADPGFVEPLSGVFLDDTIMGAGETIGSLSDHEWIWGDNDSLGYSTIYIRDDSGDPDTSGVLIEAAQTGCFNNNQPYIVVDGIEVQHGIRGADYPGGIRCYGANCLIQNCEAHWNEAHGIKIAGDNSIIEYCTASYNGAHNIASGGGVDDHVQGVTIRYCTAHHARIADWSGPYAYSGYGLKFIYVDNSFMYGNETYSNEFQGIDIDLDSLNNDIYDNYIHDNAYQGIDVELGSNGCRVFRNRCVDNGTTTLESLGQYEISVVQGTTDTEIFSNVIYKTRDAGNDNSLIYVGGWTSGCDDTLIYGNTLDGGGYSVNGIIVTGLTSPVGTKIKNNIILGTTGPCLLISGTSYTGFETDYNQYERSDADPDVISRGGTLYTIAESLSSFSQDGNSAVGDPVFTNEGTHDYSLDTGSPCIGAAVNLGANYDTGVLPSSSWPSSVLAADRDDY